MKIGIVGAMAQEVEILSQLMTDKKRNKKWQVRSFLKAKINGKEVALLQSGIGKVAAAIWYHRFYCNWLDRMWS